MESVTAQCLLLEKKNNYKLKLEVNIMYREKASVFCTFVFLCISHFTKEKQLKSCLKKLPHRFILVNKSELWAIRDYNNLKLKHIVQDYNKWNYLMYLYMIPVWRYILYEKFKIYCTIPIVLKCVVRTCLSVLEAANNSSWITKVLEFLNVITVTILY